MERNVTEQTVGDPAGATGSIVDRVDPYFLMAALYLAVGVLALAGRLGVEVGLLTGLPRPRWTTIHLVTIGGMTQALFGALPRLVRASGGGLAEGRPWLRWLALNAGYPLVLIGMTTGSTLVAVTGATVVLLALTMLGVAVTRAHGTGPILAFRTAPWFLAVGILAALGILTGVHGPGGYFGSLEAHVHANVWGFLGLTAAGALALLVPGIVGEPLPHPRRGTWSFAGIAVGASGLVAGPWLAVAPITFGGLALYLGGTALLLAEVVGAWREAGGFDARFGHVVGAYVWLLFPVPWAPFVLLTPDLVPAAAIERAAIDGLVFGWMLQLAMAFLPVVVAWTAARGRDLEEAVAVAGTPSLAGLLSINAGVLALWVTAMPVLEAMDGPLTVAGMALVGVAWALFVVDLWGVLAGSGRGGATALAGPADPAEAD